MLQPAAAGAEHVEEDVSPERQETPEATRLADHLLQIARRELAVPLADLAGIREDVLTAIDRELVDRQVSGDDRRIDQRVIVLGAIVVRQAVGGRIHRRRRTLATSRQLEPDFMRTADRLDQRDASCRPVQDDEVLADPVRGDGPAIASEPIRHDHLRTATRVRDGPAVLLGMFDPQRRPVRGPCREALDLLGVVLEAIESRRPDRHHEGDLRAPLSRDRGLDLGDMLAGRRESDRVDDRLGSLRGTGPRDESSEPHDNPKPACPRHQPHDPPRFLDAHSGTNRSRDADARRPAPLAADASLA